MLEHVAMEDELARVVGELDVDHDLVAGREIPRLLDALIRRGRLAVAADELLVAEMDMGDVRQRRGVAEDPALGRAEHGLRVHARRIKALAVDRPVATRAIEVPHALDHRRIEVEHRPQRRRHG